jgi:hypothetical protein
MADIRGHRNKKRYEMREGAEQIASGYCQKKHLFIDEPVKLRIDGVCPKHSEHREIKVQSEKEKRKLREWRMELNRRDEEAREQERLERVREDRNFFRAKLTIAIISTSLFGCLLVLAPWFIGILVVTCLITLGVVLYQDNKQKKSKMHEQPLL